MFLYCNSSELSKSQTRFYDQKIKIFDEETFFKLQKKKIIGFVRVLFQGQIHHFLKDTANKFAVLDREMCLSKP